MATIQIREIPDGAYETLRKRARAAGMSIQAYLRAQLIELARRPTPAEVWDSVEDVLFSNDTPGSSLEQTVSDLRDVRGH